jgi:anti-sigma regulatory factor (Ser/Thr protein kinase)
MTADTLVEKTKKSGASEQVAFDVQNLAAVRRYVLTRALAAGLTVDRAMELVAATGEAAANAIEHGPGFVTLKLWSEPEAFVCEVSDPAGRLRDSNAGAFPPALEAEGGRGMWLIRQFCDLVEIEAGTAKTTVRMRLWKTPSDSSEASHSRGA